MINDHFVPVAIDQWYERRQQDGIGEFYRRIAKQGPRDLNATTQGFYIADSSGNLFGYLNHHDPERVVSFINKSLKKSVQSDSAKIESDNKDKRFQRIRPESSAIVRANTKVLGGYPRKAQLQRYEDIKQNAISRDNLWIKQNEMEKLSKGQFPASLATRIGRFHLIDNTRGEPTMWNQNHIKKLDVEFQSAHEFRGSFLIQSDDNQRGYEGSLMGFCQFDENGNITRFDMVAKGDYWGAGRYTAGAPEGKFPVAVAFRLADGSDPADLVYPQGTKGWNEAYLRD